MTSNINQSNHRRPTVLICLGLALAILAAYQPLWHCGFIDYDDVNYASSNEMLKLGLSWKGVVWAFTTFRAANWHPLTWLSYLLDYQLHGLDATWFHATNLFLHIANSILLFLAFQRMTKSLGPSALVAAIFALHPLHVESVAWVSERKDVLSTFFCLLTIWAYIRYVEGINNPSVPNLLSSEASAKEDNPSFPLRFYLLSLVLFALGLMSKPMLVTLPFVLLLLDAWPLQRLRPPFQRVVLEKIPFFVLAAASSGISFVAQRAGGAVVPLTDDSMASRLANVPVAYARYIAKTFWPIHLAVLYPRQAQWPIWIVTVSCLLLLLVTLVAIWRIRAQPFLAVGWFWFLGMLVPVIGLVQVGGQSMADRYDYLPGIGLSIMLVWLAWQWIPPIASRITAVSCALLLAGCAAATWQQANYWTSSETLFAHAIAVTDRNGLMESSLGKSLYAAGRIDEALPHLRRGVVLAPGNRVTHYNLAMALFAQNLLGEGLDEYETYVNMVPNDPVAHFDFGDILLNHGQYDAAIAQFQKAIQIGPDLPEYHYKLANALSQSGRVAEAIIEYDKTIHTQPNYIQACNNLAWILASNPDPKLRNGAKAVALASRADQLSVGHNPIVAGTLAAAYAEVGQYPQAVSTVERALQLAGPENPSPLGALLRAQLALYRAGKPYRETSPASSPTPSANH